MCPLDQFLANFVICLLSVNPITVPQMNRGRGMKDSMFLHSTEGKIWQTRNQ